MKPENGERTKAEEPIAKANQAIVATAQLAAAAGIDLDRFMEASFAAFLAASPAARDQVESAQLVAQFDEMRRRGVLAAA
jgi:hypothetical protein